MDKLKKMNMEIDPYKPKEKYVSWREKLKRFTIL